MVDDAIAVDAIKPKSRTAPRVLAAIGLKWCFSQPDREPRKDAPANAAAMTSRRAATAAGLIAVSLSGFGLWSGRRYAIPAHRVQIGGTVKRL
jgi:hypothetical protein